MSDCRIEIFDTPPCTHMARGGHPVALRSNFFAGQLELACKVAGCSAVVVMGNFQVAFVPEVATSDDDDGKPTLTLVP